MLNKSGQKQPRASSWVFLPAPRYKVIAKGSGPKPLKNNHELGWQVSESAQIRKTPFGIEQLPTVSLGRRDVSAHDLPDCWQQIMPKT
jgi:hypothetical protein